MDVKGKAVLVTGAGRRVGRDIALELARRGFDVGLHYNASKGEAQEVASEARALGVEAEVFGADLADEAAIDAMFDRVLDRFPRLEALVNNAAVFFPTPLEELDGKVWDSILDVNLKAYWLCARRAAMHMTAQGHGRIVNIGCMSCWRPWPGYLAYAVSKAGVKMLTECLALDLAGVVQVNGVAPGTVLFAERMGEERKDAVRSAIPAGREGSPRDIAETVAFFLTGPDYITGQTIAVDGGRTLR